ncbi:hypothetical protein QCA50_001309 [Cerrena zonata]|uniref:Major facilitator superfamily (MFS) profile domain-containing protein n=1 Tax=Cerrena zonata TaxID=2478898 RepID=A0AAW0GSW5_9APHY
MSSRSSATVDIHQNDQAPVVDPEKDQDGDSKKLQVQVDQQPEDPSAYLVTLSPEEDPKNRSAFRKWLIVVTVSMSALCVTCASSMAAFTEAPVAEEFHIGTEVSILGVSLYVQGLGIAPLLLGPLSELYGRNIVYRASFFLFWVFSWPVAFPPHIAVFLTFRFLTGFSGAAFLSVAGGSVSDLFTNEKLANPMALFTISPFIGPVLGPLVSGFLF